MNDQSPQILSPISVLREASKVVPSVKYALGLAGIAAAGALIGAFVTGNTLTTAIVISGVFIGMFLLYIFSSLVNAGTSVLAAQFLLWGVNVFFIFFLTITATAAAWGEPCIWARALKFRLNCESDIIDLQIQKPDCRNPRDTKEWKECLILG